MMVSGRSYVTCNSKNVKTSRGQPIINSEKKMGPTRSYNQGFEVRVKI